MAKLVAVLFALSGLLLAASQSLPEATCQFNTRVRPALTAPEMPPPATYLCEAVCKVVNKHMKRYTKDPMRFITDCKVKLGDICHEECVMLSALVQRLHSKGTVVSETQIGPYWPVSLQPLGKHIKCSQQDCERCLMQGICYPTCAVPNSC